jgi:hypothetical protein
MRARGVDERFLSLPLPVPQVATTRNIEVPIRSTRRFETSSFVFVSR